MAAPFGYQALTPTAATRLTVPAGAYSAVVSVETQNIRWTVDGTAPTSTVGVLLTAGSEREFVGPEVLDALCFIEAASGAAVKVAYFPRVRI